MRAQNPATWKPGVGAHSLPGTEKKKWKAFPQRNTIGNAFIPPKTLKGSQKLNEIKSYMSCHIIYELHVVHPIGTTWHK
jgi:hypothetical protein